MADIIVYTLSDCPTCLKLKASWRRKKIQFEERQVDKNQQWMDEALALSDTVPVIVQGQTVTIGFEGELG